MGRVFGLLGTVVTLAIGMYFYSLQVKSLQPSTDAAGNPELAAITAVKNDLLAIANAERQYFASQGSYASLGDLNSGHYISINSERPPYFYDIEITANSFRATATRSSEGAPAQLWITESMQIQSSN